MNGARCFFLRNKDLITSDILHILKEKDILNEKDLEPTDKAKEKIKENPKQILKMENPSAELQKLAIDSDHEIYKKIKNLDPFVFLDVIRRNPAIIRDIDNPTEEMQMAAVNNHSFYIRDIKKPTINVIKQVINNSPSNLEYISEEYQTDEIQKYALQRFKNDQQNYRSYMLKYFKNPSEEIIKECLRIHGRNIEYVAGNKTHELKEIAVRSCPEIIQNKKIGWDDDLLEIALSLHGKAIEYISNPTEKMMKIAIASCPESIFKIRKNNKENFPKELLYYAIDKDPHVLSDDKANFIKGLKP